MFFFFYAIGRAEVGGGLNRDERETLWKSEKEQAEQMKWRVRRYSCPRWHPMKIFQNKQTKTICKNQGGKPVLIISTATANTLSRRHVHLELNALKNIK